MILFLSRLGDFRPIKIKKVFLKKWHLQKYKIFDVRLPKDHIFNSLKSYFEINLLWSVWPKKSHDRFYDFLSTNKRISEKPFFLKNFMKFLYFDAYAQFNNRLIFCVGVKKEP